MIEVDHITKRFGKANVSALSDIRFKIPDGSFAAIVGKSGSGKSTLLGLLGGLDKPTSGTVHIGNTEITRLSDRRLTKYRGRSIGFVFQQFYLIPNASARENVMLAMEFAGVGYKKRKARAIELLNLVGIDEHKQRRRPAQLSGGEQQRVAIARALANRPRLILADEPTGNLDSKTSAQVIALLKSLNQSQGTSVIVVTHDLGIAKQCDMVIELSDGKVIKVGPSLQ